jgi:hypothetical protein
MRSQRLVPEFLVEGINRGNEHESANNTDDLEEFNAGLYFLFPFQHERVETYQSVYQQRYYQHVSINTHNKQNYYDFMTFIE